VVPRDASDSQQAGKLACDERTFLLSEAGPKEDCLSSRLHMTFQLGDSRQSQASGWAALLQLAAEETTTDKRRYSRLTRLGLKPRPVRGGPAVAHSSRPIGCRREGAAWCV
jgi:hypothetical protein